MSDMHLRPRMMELFLSGTDTIVIRGMEESAFVSLCAQISDDVDTYSAEWQDRKAWIDRLIHPNLRMEEMSQWFTFLLSEKKRVISSLLFSMMMLHFPFIAEKMGKTIAIQCGCGDFDGWNPDQFETYQHAYPTLMEHRQRVPSFCANLWEGIDTHPLHPNVEIQEIHDLRALKAIAKKGPLVGYQLSKTQKQALQQQEIECIIALPAGEANILVGTDIENLKTRMTLNQMVSQAQSEGTQCHVYRFCGYLPKKAQDPNAMKHALSQGFQHQDFRQYNAYSEKGDTYTIKQDEMIHFLLEQSDTKEPRDLFFVSGTGSGKSLIYQYTAWQLYQTSKKQTIVVTPIKALMEDQVRNLPMEGVAFIHGDMTYDQRNQVLEQMRDGQLFLLYLSPEMLLSCGLESVVEPTSIGMMVVDEAHLVSSWGRSFRVDYGYLGDEILRLRSQHPFPVLATTATAVWGGPYDTIVETIELLHLESPWIVYCDIRRNTQFEIEPFVIERGAQKRTGAEEQKRDCTIQEMITYVQQDRKAIVYAPFVSDIQQLSNQVECIDSIASKVVSFTGQTEYAQKKLAEQGFQRGRKNVMMATKAFGMGIDIPDIDVVYHYRVPVLLDDYIQEIGRAGRDGRTGIARTHYHPTDLSYSYKLARMSIPQQWKLHHIFDHLQHLRKEQGNNFALSLDDIAYLFKTRSNDEPHQLRDRARIALCLIQKDLEHQYGKPILSLRSESYQYLFFSATNEDAKTMTEAFPQEIILHSPPYQRECARGKSNIQSIGSIYKIDIGKLWARHYKDKTLKNLVWLFFNQPHTLFASKIWPKTQIKMERIIDQDRMNHTFEELLTFISQLAEKVGKGMDEDRFSDILSVQLMQSPSLHQLPKAREKIHSLFNHHLTQSGIAQDGSFFYTKGTIAGKTIHPADHIQRRISQWRDCYHMVIPTETWKTKACFFDPKNDYYKKEVIPLLEALNMLQLIRTHYSGGESSVFHLQCRNPHLFLKISRTYHNNLVTHLNKNLEDKKKISHQFFETPMTDQQRWDFLESYFLNGRENHA